MGAARLTPRRQWSILRGHIHQKGKKKSGLWPWPSGPSLIKGDGDGTVNIRSLQGCLKWKDKQSQPVHHKVFEKVNHLDMLRTEEPTQNVADIIENLNKELKLNMEVKLKEENTDKVLQHNIDSQTSDEEKIIPDDVYPIIEVLV